jgi:methylated-DNA-protein-cysteine methyltransferase-like protein
MPSSPFFARIKADLLAMTRQVPRGRVATFSALGDLIDVPARHVAYILATLDDAEAAVTPWHRVVPGSGQLARSKTIRHNAQIDLLRSEGVGVINEKVLDLEEILFTPKLPKGALAKRPSDAPPGKPGRPRGRKP